MKAFVSIALAGIPATGFTSMVIADDTKAPAASQQAEEAPTKERAARRGEGRRATAASATAAGAKVGEAAPNFTLKTTDGKDWSLSDAKGKVVVLEWVNPNCPVCVRVCKEGIVADTLKGCKEQFPDVVYVAINSSAAQPDSLSATAEYLKSHKLEVPALLDNDGKVGQMYGARTTPHCYVIDQNGVLVYQGAIDDSPSGGAKMNYVVNAVKQIKAGEKVSPSETKPYGCSVKYKKN
jgi:alkyl hydroperoxide reductase subunit AhpC